MGPCIVTVSIETVGIWNSDQTKKKLPNYSAAYWVSMTALLEHREEQQSEFRKLLKNQYHHLQQ